MRVLSIDLGDVRTGVAISDLGNTLATPLCVIVERNKYELLKKFANLMELRAEGLDLLENSRKN